MSAFNVQYMTKFITKKNMKHRTYIVVTDDRVQFSIVFLHFDRQMFHRAPLRIVVRLQQERKTFIQLSVIN